MLRSVTWIGLVLALALTACGEPPIALDPGPDGTPTGQPGPGGTMTAGEVHPDAIWFDVLGVTQAGGDGLGIDLVESDEELADAWGAHGFDEAVPDVGFDEHVVALIRRGDNACPDEVAEVRLAGGELTHTLVSHPGPCADPYIVWAYAIAYHRGDLGEQVTIRIAETDGPDGELEATFALPPYDGPPAPAAFPPQRQPTEDELDALFADHPVRRCTELPDPREEVLARQDPRDETTPSSLDFEVAGDVQGAYAAEHADEFGWLMVDEAAGEWVVGGTADVDGHRERLERRHPGQRFRVVETPHAERDLAAARQSAEVLMGGEDPAVMSMSHFAYVELGIIDPTREDLDAIAEVVDPDLVCVELMLSGISPASER